MRRNGAVIACACAIVVVGLGLAVRAGDMDPPAGAVAPTMRTLDEVYNAVAGTGGCCCGEDLPGEAEAAAEMTTMGLPLGDPAAPIPVYAIDHVVNSGMSGAGGDPEHAPLCVTKAVDAFSPGFQSLLNVGGGLQLLTLNLLDGAGQARFVITLMNARVDSIELTMVPRCGGQYSVVEKVCFTYDRIKWADVASGNNYQYIVNQPTN
jgi:type VI protein secretion system component Hcp